MSERAARERVAQRLELMNARFYERYAEQFDGTRMSGWAGWEELIDLLPREAPLSVLDLGCGNGRLARVLERATQRDPRLQVSAYHGVDRCRPLLEAARAHERRQALSFPCTWAPWTWESLDAQPTALSGSAAERWGWVTLFGVTHHVFGFERRLELLTYAAQRLAPGALLSVSFWDFGASERWEKKRASWESLSAEWGEDLELIEEGDALLGWGGSKEHLRYCHWVSTEEEEALDLALCERLDHSIHTLTVGRDPKGHNRYRTWVSAP